MDNDILMKHVLGELPVDAVVATVDPDAPGWREAFARHAPSAAREGVATARFRKNAPVSLQVRLIRRNMPWIRTVWLAVADEGHLADEDLSGCGDVRPAPHRLFVPADRLPTFNSYAIEWFVHRLPGLAGAFVYFNDDFYPTAPSTMRDFVDAEGRTLLTMHATPWARRRSLWDRLCHRTYREMADACGDLRWPSSPCHAPRLWLVDENEGTLKLVTGRHPVPAQRFRDCSRDVDAVVAFCYATAARHGWAPRPADDYLYRTLATMSASPAANARVWSGRKFTCVNDGGVPVGAAYKRACGTLVASLEAVLGQGDIIWNR